MLASRQRTGGGAAAGEHLLAVVRGYDLAYARQRLRLGLRPLRSRDERRRYHDLLAGIQRTLMRESKLPAAEAPRRSCRCDVSRSST
jgi:hypothetical protein